MRLHRTLSLKNNLLVHIIRTSGTVSNRYGESRYPCLIPDFRGIALTFSPLNLMFTIDFLYIAFIMFRHRFFFSPLSSPDTSESDL
ncbi:hypothetical protein STEG23_026553, partial [Scotinomys teguina]